MRNHPGQDAWYCAIDDNQAEESPCHISFVRGHGVGYDFGTCNAPVKAGAPGEEEDRCSDDNPFFLQGAHTPMFTKMKIGVNGGACGNEQKAVTFGLKMVTGAEDYVPDFSYASDTRSNQAVKVFVGHLLPDNSSGIACDELQGELGSACISTSRQTDHDTCKAHGLIPIFQVLLFH